MKTSDFATTIVVEQPPKEVIEAISHPGDWWSGEVEGKALQVNDEFTYRYQDLHYSKQRVIELIPDQKVVWLVTESIINYAEDKNEWTGTRICFEISSRKDNTQVRFTHIGLDQEVECFDSCSNSWRQLIHQSLFSLITTGRGVKLLLA